LRGALSAHLSWLSVLRLVSCLGLPANLGLLAPLGLFDVLNCGLL
jgi:hypothetical protein